MSELIHQFGIDWKLLIAQVVNFAVLLFLLSKFAYRPIIAMLRKRKEDIEQGVRFTKEAEEALSRVDASNELKIQQTRVDALVIIGRAEDVARARKEEIAVEAVKKSEAIVAASRRAIIQEKARMNEAVYADAEHLIRAGITQVLGVMPAGERDRELIRAALQELKTIRS